MKLLRLTSMLITALIFFSACRSNSQTPTFETIANESTDVVRASLLNRQGGASGDTVEIYVQGSYKGNLRYRDRIEVQLPYYDLDIFGVWTFHLLFFLRTTEGDVMELAFPNHSVYLLDMCEYDGNHDFTYINASQDGGLTIEYQELLHLWDSHMQSIYDTYSVLDFYARLERNGVISLRNTLPDGVEPIEYPIVIGTMDELIAHWEFYVTHANRWSHNEELCFTMRKIESNFDIYTEEFFSDRYLVLFELFASSGSISFRVDSILENGDIFVTLRDIWPGHGGTTDFLQVYVILEVSRDILPEQFNVIMENRWQ